ncbi:hypothetical protein HHI36_004355, partial [Cryptolaemus montrouzieri]
MVACIANIVHEEPNSIDVLDFYIDVKTSMFMNDASMFEKHHLHLYAKDILERVSSDPTFIKRVVTGDETW